MKTKNLTPDNISIRSKRSKVYVDPDTEHFGDVLAGWAIGSDEMSKGSVKIQATNERILLGDATEPSTGIGIFMGKDGSDYEFRVGDPSGDYIHWDGTNLNITGKISIGSGDNVFKADADGIYLGNTVFASAPFRVSMAGAITATSATITGSLTTGAGSNIDGQYLGNLTVATGALANLSVTAGKIDNATITATQIADATITGTQIAAATITGGVGGNISAATITASQIANATITGTQIAATTILAGNIGNGTITTSQISATAGITGGQIASASIQAGNIANLTITAAQIANLTITATQIADATVTGGKIATNTITGTKLKIGNQSWSHDLVFSSTDLNTVAWTLGTITMADGSTTYSIDAGNTGDMTARTYVYLDIATSVTVFQTTTTAGTAVGDGKILIAVAENSTTAATFQVYGGIGGIAITGGDIEGNSIVATQIASGTITTNEIAANTIEAGDIKAATITTTQIAANTIVASNITAATITGTEIAATTITAGNIAANTITANEITGNTITGSEITGTTLSGIFANLGTITAGNITIDSSGYIKGGQTAYNTGIGFFLGYDTDAYKFSIGNATTDYLNWTGSKIQIACSDPDAIVINYGSDILLKHGGDIKFTSVTAPTACTATLVATDVGNVDAGTHIYKVTYVNETGETELGTASNYVTTDATHKQVDLSDIPLSTSGSVISRKIYRTRANGIDYYLLTTIADNTTTTYTDNVADVNLTGGRANEKENNSFGKMLIDGVSGLSLSTSNTFVGQNAGLSNITGYQNSAMGYYALRYNTEGYRNSAMGNYALYSNTTGYKNSAVGYFALSLNTEGYENSAVGSFALGSNTTGSFNSAIGYHALRSNTTGWRNSAMGNYALRSNTEGYRNSAMGYYALASNTTGYENSAVGTYALSSITTGFSNSAMGYYALSFNTTGTNNLAMGNYALRSNGTGSGNVALGYYAGRYETGSNAFYVNNQSRTNTAGDKAKSLLYGVFAPAAADQKLTINALLNQSVSKTPASAAATGTAGDIAWDAGYIYVCTATDTWKRVAIATW